MKALVVGCGSIGRRHIHNLTKLDRVEKIFVLTKAKDCSSVLDQAKGKVEIIRDLDGVKVDFAVVCNETHKHVETAICLAKKGFHLFIEKPISGNLNRINTLKRIIKVKRIKFLLGYNLRFLGAIKYIKAKLNKKILGDLYFAKIEAGQYLPQWRKNIDYRKSYSSSRNRGGGVTLDLSHEIDYMRLFFSDPIHWKVIKTKVSELGIDSDDIFEGLYIYDDNFICNVHLDYLQKDKRRQIRIVGTKGVLQCDFVKKEIRIKKYNSKESVIADKALFDIDKTYEDEIRHFINMIEKNLKPEITLDDGVRVLKLIEENV